MPGQQAPGHAPPHRLIPGQPVRGGQDPAGPAASPAAVPHQAGGPSDPAHPPARRPPLRPAPAWLVVLPAVVTLLVVLWKIQRPSYWRDEG
ncbi:MAG: hypothetical protein ABJB47_05650, partial [Actinomycetota bacterium]